MTVISNSRNTGNIAQDRRVVDMGKQIALLDPNESPFVTFLKVAKKDARCVYNPRFEWLEDDLITAQSTVATAISSATATSLSVEDGSIFRSGDIIHLPAVGENMLVTAVSSNTLTVSRAYGTTEAAAAIAAESLVLNLGPAMRCV